jgi:hypothetical protein
MQVPAEVPVSIPLLIEQMLGVRDVMVTANPESASANTWTDPPTTIFDGAKNLLMVWSVPLGVTELLATDAPLAPAKLDAVTVNV